MDPQSALRENWIRIRIVGNAGSGSEFREKAGFRSALKPVRIHNIGVNNTVLTLKVDSNMKLGEWAGLCKIDQEGKARKVCTVYHTIRYGSVYHTIRFCISYGTVLYIIRYGSVSWSVLELRCFLHLIFFFFSSLPIFLVMRIGLARFAP
jgi:hypothetical protein